MSPIFELPGDPEELLKFAKEGPVEEPETAFGEKKEWSFLFHFAKQRENLLQTLEFWPDMRILEVGSGAGALSGALSMRCSRLCCLEWEEDFQEVNRARKKAGDCVVTYIGSETQIEGCYDLILLVDVLSRKDVDPEGLLKSLKAHLSEDGQIVIAGFNRLGLRVFAGCPTDGKYFAALERGSFSTGGRIYAKHELFLLLEQNGYEAFSWYYPWPDHRLPLEIFSDAYLPSKGDLKLTYPEYDQERMYLFDEPKVWDGILGEGLFPSMANAFIVIAGEKK